MIRIQPLLLFLYLFVASVNGQLYGTCSVNVSQAINSVLGTVGTLTTRITSDEVALLNLISSISNVNGTLQTHLADDAAESIELAYRIASLNYTLNWHLQSISNASYELIGAVQSALNEHIASDSVVDASLIELLTSLNSTLQSHIVYDENESEEIELLVSNVNSTLLSSISSIANQVTVNNASTTGQLLIQENQIVSLSNQVTSNTATISSLSGLVVSNNASSVTQFASQSTAIAAVNTEVSANTAAISTLNAEVAANNASAVSQFATQAGYISANSALIAANNASSTTQFASQVMSMSSLSNQVSVNSLSISTLNQSIQTDISNIQSIQAYLSAPPSLPVVWHEIVVAGQSNANGYNKYWTGAAIGNSPFSDPLNIQQTRIFQYTMGSAYSAHSYDYQNPGTPLRQSEMDTIMPAFEPLGWPDPSAAAAYSATAGSNYGPGISAAISKANAFLSSLPLNHQVLIVPCAIGGTALLNTSTTNAVIGYPNSRWNINADLFQNCVAKANKAFNLVQPVSTEIYFVQGEADAAMGAALNTTEYQIEFDQMLLGFRSQIYNSTNAPIVLHQMVRDYVYDSAQVNAFRLVDAIHMDTPRRIPFSDIVLSAFGTAEMTSTIHHCAQCQRQIGLLSGTIGITRAKANSPSAGIAPFVLANVTIPANTITPTSFYLYFNRSATPTRVTDYVIQYKLTSSSIYTSFSHSPFVVPTVIQVTGLTAATDYNVQIAAINEAGTGVFSPVLSITTLDASQPTNLVATITTSTSVVLTWLAPTNPVITSPTGYSIGYRLSSSGPSGSFTTFGTVGVGVLTTTVTGLTAGTFYDFAVSYTGSTNSPNTILLSIDTWNPAAGVPAPFARFTANRAQFNAYGYISTLYDQSGNGRHQTQSSGVNSPFLTSIGTIPAVQFVPVSWTSNAAGFVASGVDYTKMWMGTIDDLNWQGNLLSGTTCHAMYRSGKLQQYAGHSNNYFTSNSKTLAINQVYVFHAVYSASGSLTSFYQNGVFISSGASTTCSDTTLQLNGYGNVVGGTLIQNGGYMKLITAGIWNSAFTATIVSAHTASLTSYYGITLSTY